MKRYCKLIATMLTACLLAGTWTMTVLADSAISSTSIHVGVYLAAGDRLSDDFNYSQEVSEGNFVISNSSKYTVSEARWVTSTNKDMTIGETPKMKVTLDAQSGYYFKGTYRSSNVSIKGGTFVSASRKSEETLEITLKVNPIKGKFEDPIEVYWRDSGLGRAKWEGADGSEAYDVHLYRNTSMVHKLEGIKATTYNFYPYMTKAGTYSFKVRAVPSTTAGEKYGKKSDWVESDEMYIAKEDVSDGSGQGSEASGNGPTGSGPTGNVGQVGWVQNGNRWYYRYPDGNSVKNNWMQIANKWYLFDGDGWMLTGWQQKNNRWFFLNPSGDMLTGWSTQGDKIYYLFETAGNDQGVMCTGWIQHSNKWYYGSTNGAMIKGWFEVDGNWRYFYPDTGVMAVNTTIDSFKVDANGIWQRN